MPQRFISTEKKYSCNIMYIYNVRERYSCSDVINNLFNLRPRE